MPQQNLQLASSGLTSLVPILAVVLIIGGIGLYIWMVRPARVAVRTMLGTWHQNRHGAIVKKSEEEKPAEEGAPPITGERSAFDLGIFGEAGSVVSDDQAA